MVVVIEGSPGKGKGKFVDGFEKVQGHKSAAPGNSSPASHCDYSSNDAKQDRISDPVQSCRQPDVSQMTFRYQESAVVSLR